MFLFTTANVDLTGGAGSAGTCNRINGFHVSAGGAASTVQLRNGAAAGPIFVEIKIPANGSVHFAGPGARILFPKGLFIVPDANVSRGSIQPG